MKPVTSGGGSLHAEDGATLEAEKNRCHLVVAALVKKKKSQGA
jgi:hypothetical protein